MYQRKISRVLFYFGYVFLYTPILLIILYSFNRSNTLSWQGLSFKWYATLAQNKILLDGAMISLQIAILSATLAVILGTLCANACMLPQRSHRVLGFLATAPLVIPEMITGLSLLILFVAFEQHMGWFKRGMLTVIIAHTTLGIAYVTAIVRARLRSLSPLLREAALDLGARPYKVFFLITLPLILPSLGASWLIAFILSFDDVILASFTTGPGTTTLPLVIFSSLKMGYTPQINALATCIIALVSFLIVTAGYVMHKREDS